MKFNRVRFSYIYYYIYIRDNCNYLYQDVLTIYRLTDVNQLKYTANYACAIK